MLSDPENFEFIERLKFAGGIGDVAASGAAAALDDQAHMQQYVAAIEQSKKLVIASLPQIGYEFHLSPTNFMLLRVSDSTKAVEQLRDHNVIVHDLSDDGIRNDLIRITLGTPSQMERLLVIMGRLSPVLATGFNRNREETVINKRAATLREMTRVR